MIQEPKSGAVMSLPVPHHTQARGDRRRDVKAWRQNLTSYTYRVCSRPTLHPRAQESIHPWKKFCVEIVWVFPDPGLILLIFRTAVLPIADIAPSVGLIGVPLALHLRLWDTLGAGPRKLARV